MNTVTVLRATEPALELETLEGEVLLSAHKVAYSRIHQALFVADVHLGKAATFRNLGVPVPSGTTLGNLDRLSSVIQHFSAQRLFFLGDLLHAKAAHNAELLEKLHSWRTHHSDVEMTLIRGNHDSKAGDPPASLNVQVVQEPFMLGRLALCHHPQRVDHALVLAGHEHPVIVLSGKGKSRARLPCFHLKDGQLILPSFGEFTGGYAVQPAPGERVFAVV